MVETRDIDPSFWTLRGAVENYGLDAEEAYEFCTIFIGFFHFGSTDKLWRDISLDVTKMSYGLARRGFRANDKVYAVFRGLRSLRVQIFKQKDNGRAGWKKIYEMVSMVKFMGPYSAYCFCHILKLACGFNITAPDLGFFTAGTANRGTLKCLSHVTGIPVGDLFGNDKLHRQIYDEVAGNVGFDGLEDFESILCNYLSLKKNLYYVGRDIDRAMPALQGLSKEWWKAREKYFPKESLGEFGGWTGIRKELMGKLEKGKSWL